MRIVVDALPLLGLATGISRYLRNLYGAMKALNGPSNMDVVYFDGARAHLSMPRVAKPALSSKITAALWSLPDPLVFALRCVHWLIYEHRLRQIIKAGHFDLYHATSFVPAALSNTPQVFSLYDLSLIRYPQTHPRERVWFFRFWKRRRMSCASHILTLSEFMRREICRVLQWSQDRVTAVPLAPAEHFAPRNPEAVASVRKRLGLPNHYLLFVGSLEPRKNIGLAVKALHRCRSDIPLVLAGWEAWGDKTWLETVPTGRRQPQIFRPGFVDDETLACLYSGATALIYPSLYEGFGLPILEAMACGCPVICSNTSSMPEVAGGAARLIDPGNPDDLAAAIDEVTGSAEYRQNLIHKGHARAAAFSWTRTARETQAVLSAIIAKNHSP